jgi:hypothetical protein
MPKSPDANEIHRTQGADALRQAFDDAVAFKPKVKHQRTNGPAFDDDDGPFGEIPTAPKTPQQPDNSLEVFDAGDDLDLPPPRGWLLGNQFCRGFLSSLVAPGAAGKTALRLAQLLSLAIGRNLTGQHVFMRCVYCCCRSKTAAMNCSAVSLLRCFTTTLTAVS